MLKEITDKLEAEFPKAEHKKNATGFTYVETDKYISRLNEIFGNSWSFEVLTPIDKAYVEFADTVVTSVRVTVPNVVGKNEDGSYIVNGILVKDGIGSSPVARFKPYAGKPNPARDGKVIDLGNNYKSSTSDGLKVACRLLGIGLYMYDKSWYEENKEVSSLGDEKEQPKKKLEEVPKQALPDSTANSMQLTAIRVLLGKAKKSEDVYKAKFKVSKLEDLKESEAKTVILELQELSKVVK